MIPSMVGIRQMVEPVKLALMLHHWFVGRVSAPFHYGSMMSVSRFVQVESLLARCVFGVRAAIFGGK